MREYILRSLITISIVVPLVIALPAGTCHAASGDFWYGVWGTFMSGAWGEGVYDSLASRFHMNLVVDRLGSQTGLDSISRAGLRAIVWPDGIDFDSNKVFRYSSAHFLRYEAEGDTVAFQWQPLFYDPPAGCVTYTGGSLVIDTLADNDTALFFNPLYDTSGSTVYADNPMFRADGSWEIPLKFNIRTIPDTTPTVLMYCGVRNRDSDSVLWSDTLMISEVADDRYHAYPLPYEIPDDDPTRNWWNEIFVQWTGAESLWVDWIEDSDPDGVRLEDERADTEIKDFVQEWAFDGDSTIIAFLMAEEMMEDANVYPQKRVDSLVKAVDPDLHGFTQNHFLSWWSTVNDYGGRVAASARLEDESHVGGLCYPFSGYNPYATTITNFGSFTLPSLLCAAAPVPSITCADVGSDTSVCFQDRMDQVGDSLRLFKRFCQSLEPSASFVPFMQGFTEQVRLVPRFCSDDTTWYNGYRPATETEYKCHAGVALANGVTGLVYFRYYGIQYSEMIAIPGCIEDSTEYVYARYDGLNTLPELQDALQNFIGPFIDSVGWYFGDPDFWKGGGRVDPVPHSDTAGGASCLFDSVRSLTFTEEGDSAYIEAGVYQDDTGDDYFLLLNRRAYDTIPQEIRSWLDLDTGMYYIVDLYSYDSVLTGSLPTGEIPFKTSLNPGEFKFFKIVPVTSGYVAGSAVSQQWEGGIRVGGNITVDSSRSLTILSPASIRVDSGGSYRFNVYGSIVIEGTEDDPVILRSSADSASAGKQDWFGIIKHNGAGDLTITHADIANAYKGVWIIDTVSPPITATIDRCNIGNGYMSGVWVETDTVSTVTIAHSEFYDITYYGIQIYKGLATVDSNTFWGYFLNGVRVEGSSSRVTGGVIRQCRFDALERNNGYAVNLQSISDDGRDFTQDSGYVLGDNRFGGVWDGSNMTAVMVYDCDDPLRFLRNYIRGDNRAAPAYGILNFNTQTYIYGDNDAPDEDSKIEEARYGLYCMSSSSAVTERAVVRECYFDDCQYNVYVYSNCRVDLGTGKYDMGLNTFWTSIVDSCDLAYTPSWNVYNCNTSDTVSALYNYWAEWDTCGYYPHLSGLVNWQFALDYPPGQGKIFADYDERGSAGVTPELTPENYPNPFNSGTVIQFSLEKPGPVEVTVYNVLGQRVATLCTGEREAGVQRIPWDGRNARGQPVPSGIYLYRIRTTDREITKKMVIVK